MLSAEPLPLLDEAFAGFVAGLLLLAGESPKLIAEGLSAAPVLAKFSASGIASVFPPLFSSSLAVMLLLPFCESGDAPSRPGN